MKHPISFKKLNRDISPNLTQQGDYYDAVNGRVVMNDSQTAFAFSNEKGTTQFNILPTITNNTGTSFTVNLNGGGSYNVPYTNTTELNSLPSITEEHKIIALTSINDRFIIISQYTDHYLIWDWDEGNSRFQLMYYNDFSAGGMYRDLRIETRYENDNIQKIYFTDGLNFWHINLSSTNDYASTIDLPLNQLRAFPEATLDNPTLEAMLPGGAFEAGAVQYAYNLYSDSGAETKVSPFSDLFYVSNRYNGLNEADSNSQAFKIKIDNIPSNFNLINIYRIFYNSATATPEVSLIIEDQLQDTEYTFVDDNNLEASSSTLSEVLFLGSDTFVPEDMAVKDNVMFPTNITYSDYDPTFDARAYGWNSSSQALIQDSVSGNQTLTALNDSVAETHDAINPSVKAEVGDANYKTYRFQFDGTTPGVEGPNVAIIFRENERNPYDENSTTIAPNSDSYANNFSISNAWGNRSFKRDEVYRFFIRFTNARGQKSFAKWIADVRMPDVTDYDLADENTGLTVKDLGIRVDVQNLPSDAVSWEILMEERSEADKTIKAQGILNSTLLVTTGTKRDHAGDLVPNPFLRCYHTDANISTTSGGTFDDGLGWSYEHDRNSNSHVSATTRGDITNFTVAEVFDSNTDSYQLIDYVVEFYSPEILQKRYRFDIADTDYINFIGGIKLTDKIKFLGRVDANTTAGSSPATAFSDLSVGQNANPLADKRSFIRWNGAEGEVFVPGETASATPGDSYYINSYIAAFFDHTCNSIVKQDIVGTAKFIPYSSIRGERVHSWNAGSNNRSSLMDNCELTFKDNSGKNFYYGAHVNDRLAFNLDYYDNGSGTAERNGLGDILTSNNANDNLITNREATPKTVLVDYKAIVPNQYGGNTYKARQLNNPVVISDNIPVGTTQRVIYGGDTFVCLWNFMRQQCYQGYYRRRTQRENILIPIETSINLDLRHDNDYYENLGRYQTTFSDYELPLDVYSRRKQYPFSSVKPITYIQNNKFGARVLGSDTKVNGELKDSWLIYRPNTYIDLEGTFGDITGIIEDRDQLFTFQPEAISQLIINPRVQTVDEVGLQLGKGDLLYDYQYMTTTSGSVNKFSLTKTPYGVMYYDALNNKLSLLNRGEQPISDIKGMNSFFRTIDKSSISADTPNSDRGVVGYYDHETKETFMGFRDGVNSQVINYSHLNDAFHYRHDFSFGQALNLRNTVYWLNRDGDTLYTHKTGNYGEYFGSYVDSYVTFVANPSYINSVYDTVTFTADTKNGSSDVFNSSIDSIQVYNEHQDTGSVSLTYGSELKRKFREWKVNVPRESGTRNRMMSPYAYFTMKWTNTGTSRVLKDVVVNYRPKTVDYS